MIKIILILIFSLSILEASQSLKNLDKHEIFDAIEKGSAYLLKDRTVDTRVETTIHLNGAKRLVSRSKYRRPSQRVRNRLK